MFDMHGNVFEWCQTVYRREYGTDNAPEDLTVTDSDRRVLRGGSFFDVAPLVRSASRTVADPDDRNADVGFRVARTYN